MDVFDAINTTRAMRRLDPTRAVSDDDLRTLVAAAIKGPSGGNMQPTKWMVVRDPALKQAIGAIYHDCWYDVRGWYATKAATDEGKRRVMTSADHLADHMGEAGALVIPCTPGDDPILASSVYGAVQNLCLAARALGLGTTLTTVHRRREAEVNAVLGIPEGISTWAIIPVGYPLGRWGEAKRRPAAEVTYWDQWGSAEA